ncbi:hypothetical protein [Leptospira barantonii]|uniref:Uncharacterized protein n=1 Tax=Leptospira barantonii TaxID=2023184 RepID=A0ABX4NL84_9LEPT|nr:hypothetical protein [Leptospira barantonii]PJZ57574.1 hypothetical protein CH367_09550 [Leptospira barantonii]
MKFLSYSKHKLFVLLSAFLILVCLAVLIQPNGFVQNDSPVATANESSETPEAEAEKEKSAELKLEDLASQDDGFSLHYDLEPAFYGDSSDWIVIQHFSEIENPPPELRISI